MVMNDGGDGASSHPLSNIELRSNMNSNLACSLNQDFRLEIYHNYLLGNKNFHKSLVATQDLIIGPHILFVATSCGSLADAHAGYKSEINGRKKVASCLHKIERVSDQLFGKG